MQHGLCLTRPVKRELRDERAKGCTEIGEVGLCCHALLTSQTGQSNAG